MSFKIPPKLRKCEENLFTISSASSEKSLSSTKDSQSINCSKSRNY